ncbi:ABC transporter permease [Rhizobium laguerreae]|uniref:ABC transporter permease n=1 Tax=Rhizobium laguerreae TaxID=1076926 RepID=UPI001C924E89|nr:ABC transporter permease [Rhizobium laguerreae]MBY3150867.1 ABC transporter permease [Rhizobium laguerreae]
MDLSKDFDVLRTLVRREFRIRYKDSFLGVLWVFGAPLLMIATYSFFMFGIVRSLGNGFQGLADLGGLWVCLGLWQWLNESTNRAGSAFHDNAALVKRTPLKLILLPLSNVVVSSVGFVLPLSISCVLMLAIGVGPWSFVGLGIGFVSIMPWFVGLALFASVVGTFLRDAKYAMPLCFNVGLFLSPILYSSEEAPVPLKALMYLNPLGYHFEFLKAAIGGREGDVTSLAVASLAGIAFMFASARLFTSRCGEFADVV